jgi:Zn-dependent peptidase ImmA (M78 family)
LQLNGSDLVAKVRLRANKLIRGLDGPPFALDCQSVRDAAAITHIVQPHKLRVHGRVFWRDTGYVIEIKSTLPPSRRVFTLGHEIAHTFFMRPQEGAVSQRIDSSTEAFAEDNQEEYLCDLAAAEMLMPAAALLNRRRICTPDEMSAPENAFLRRVIEYKPSARSVILLAREFGTSLATTARRFAEMDVWSCHIGFWAANENGNPEFQSGYSGRTKVGIPRGFVAPPRSVVGVVAVRRKRAEGWSESGLMSQMGDTHGKVYMEAVPISDNRVLSVILLEPSPESLVAASDKRLKGSLAQSSLRFSRRTPSGRF